MGTKMKKIGSAPTEVVLLGALEKLCGVEPEKTEQRLKLPLSNDFVLAWLGGSGLPREVLVESKICPLGTKVGETLELLRARLAA